MNIETQKEIERHVYAHDSIGYTLLLDFLTEGQIDQLITDSYNEYSKVIEDQGIAALEIVQARLQGIITRTGREYQAADDQAKEKARSIATIAMIQMSEDKIPEDRAAEIQREYNSEHSEIIAHRTRINYTQALAYFRKEVIRAVIHRYALFGDTGAANRTESVWPEPKGSNKHAPNREWIEDACREEDIRQPSQNKAAQEVARRYEERFGISISVNNIKQHYWPYRND
jgi:hypothetical protein